MHRRSYTTPSVQSSSPLFARTFLAGTALLALATAGPLQAQTDPGETLEGHQPPATQLSAEVEEAAALEARAWALRDLMDERHEAARLYRKAAELRPDHDPQKVQNLREAARMSHYAGRSDRAIRDAEAAATAALRQGDVIEAGQAYVDAAWLAAQTGDRDRTEALLQEARLLASSPLLAQEERQDLLRRIDTAV
jgi:tetratricopeptide (TPR) repeat protein